MERQIAQVSLNLMGMDSVSAKSQAPANLWGKERVGRKKTKIAGDISGVENEACVCGQISVRFALNKFCICAAPAPSASVSSIHRASPVHLSISRVALHIRTVTDRHNATHHVS